MELRESPDERRLFRLFSRGNLPRRRRQPIAPIASHLSPPCPRQVWAAVSSSETIIQASRLSGAAPQSGAAVSFGGKSAKGIAIGQASPPPPPALDSRLGLKCRPVAGPQAEPCCRAPWWRSA